MNPHCDQVTERVALGEALGELAAHAQSCARCQRVVAMPGKLGATRHDVDPGLGFAARMTVGAQERLDVRRRRRIVGGVAATVAAGALAVLFVTRPADPTPAVQPAIDTTQHHQPEPVIDPANDADLKALVNLADVERSSRLSADWRQIKKPLVPYRKLFKQVAVQVKHEAASQGVVP
ncbi:MAG: hypothetical protein SFX73_13035 [Kofleriaceae bacterium]|nr:hypothetical protein [Kofleriaceae bacterium]